VCIQDTFKKKFQNIFKRQAIKQPEITVRLFTRGLPYVPSTKNHPTCKNYIASYKAFQEHQLNSRRFPVFPGAISNSRRFPGFPGVVDTLSEPKTKNPVKVN